MKVGANNRCCAHSNQHRNHSYHENDEGECCCSDWETRIAPRRKATKTAGWKSSTINFHFHLRHPFSPPSLLLPRCAWLLKEMIENLCWVVPEFIRTDARQLVMRLMLAENRRDRLVLLLLLLLLFPCLLCSSGVRHRSVLDSISPLLPHCFRCCFSSFMFFCCFMSWQTSS
jgi:hypothetical protein